jgi:hypothetical protein
MIVTRAPENGEAVLAPAMPRRSNRPARKMPEVPPACGSV